MRSDAIKDLYLKTSDEIIVTSGYTLRGIVTNSDILQRLVVPANERRISSIPIKSIMSSPIIMLRSTDNVSSALKTMRSNNIKQILIVDSNVVGKLKKANDYGSPRSGTVD
ncbi:MAG TPA: CBS domain-containing protein [Nitrososphaeraceae archaeon]|nr:CBS domain-containing protein [Nitrososphaeraceae archaeon]